MRSITKIRTDIKDFEEALDKLYSELEDFRNKCPHSPEFVSCKTEDRFRDDMGKENYSHTLAAYECYLCEGVWSRPYCKTKENKPSLKQIINNEFEIVT